jgi:uncharacterized protein YuzE
MKRIPLSLDVDEEVDAAYIELPGLEQSIPLRVQIVIEDERLAGEIILDVDEDSRVVGIEFLGVSTLLRPAD